MKLPDEFQWVDLSDDNFNRVLDEVVNGSDNLLVQAAAGCGKSLMIKVASRLLKNAVILSTTGKTALQLASDDVKASTLHSFFLIPPVEIIPGQTTVTSNVIKNFNNAKVIVIDEVSMMSSMLFDSIVLKLRGLRRNKDLPRFVLFGDLMQLPPVVNMTDNIVREYYESNYEKKVMFFNSHSFSTMGFKVETLRRVYRQNDPEYKRRLIEVGFGEVTKETLDYFNKRVMSVKDYEIDHHSYIRLSPVNSVVNKVNAEYVATFPGKATSFKANNRGWKGTTPNDETVFIKPGIQVLCIKNAFLPEDGVNYRNGTIGEVTQIDPDGVWIRTVDGKNTKVLVTQTYQFSLSVDKFGQVEYNPTGSFTQLDCKPMKAMTIHKAQGQSLDAAYLQLNKWTPEGLLYVALSRTTTIEGLGVSRPLVMSDLSYNQESWDFLQLGGVKSAEKEPDWDETVGGNE